MSRGFGSTFGAGTSDSIETSYAGALGIQSTVSANFFINGNGGGGLGRILDQNNGTTAGGIVLENRSSAVPGTLAVVYGFSVNAGTWQFPAPASGAWHSLVITFDGSAPTPAVYVDGIIQSLTNLATPVGSFASTATNFYLGNRADGTRNWDGLLAHLALWNVILDGAAVAALANGTPPPLIGPRPPLFYFPLTGIFNPELDLINGNSAAQTGTRLGPSEPPFITPLPRVQRFIRPYEQPGLLAFLATLALMQPASAIALTGLLSFAAALVLLQGAQAIALTATTGFAVTAFELTQPANSVSISALTDSLTRWEFTGPTNSLRRKVQPVLTRIRSIPSGLIKIRNSPEILGD